MPKPLYMTLYHNSVDFASLFQKPLRIVINVLLPMEAWNNVLIRSMQHGLTKI